MSDTFADRLTDATRACGVPLCVGLDPFPDKIPAMFGDARNDAHTMESFFEAILERVAGKCAAVKPQIGLFEPYGPEGVEIARALTANARTRGLPVILDAKRGDIGTTAEGYARTALGAAPGFDADCVTVNPYLGLDSIEPFLATAQANGKGVAVLVRTSNPGARDVQDLVVGNAPLWTRVAEMLEPAMHRLTSESGWSNLMVVAGATWPEEARRLRTILPNALFLVPGYGAQGASAADALSGLVGGVGGVVSASRSILYPPAAMAARTMSDWKAAIDDALLTARMELSAA